MCSAWQSHLSRTTGFRPGAADPRSARRRSTGTAYTRLPFPLIGGHKPIDGQFDVSFADRSDAPIYAGLVEEQGDVPAEVRRVAEQTLREVDRALDFSSVRAPGSFR
ncbi:hypothetical protein GCM10010518_53240 [Kitasatospora cinereorecta]